MPSDGVGKNVHPAGDSITVSSIASKFTDLAVHTAAFTAVAHCCLGLLFIAGFQVYIVLETFVRPLMWALLTGTFLCPFKTFLAGLVKSWLAGVRSSSTPILVALAWTPIGLVDRGLDRAGSAIVDFFREHGTKFLYTVGGIVAYFFMYFYSPYLEALGTTLSWLLWITTTLSTNMIWLIIISYGAALQLLWATGFRRYLLHLAVPLWILVGFYFYYLLGDIAIPIYLFLALQIGLGYGDLPSSASKTMPHSRMLSANPSGRGSGENTPVETEPVLLISLTSPAKSPGMHYSVHRPSLESCQETEEMHCVRKVEDDRHPTVPENGAPVYNFMRRVSNGSWAVGNLLHTSYRNVTDVLTDNSSAAVTPRQSIKSDTEGADPAAILSSLNELAVNGNLGEGTRYLTYIFWMFVLLEVLMSFYAIPVIVLPVTYRFFKILLRRQRVKQRLGVLFEPIKVKFMQWTDERNEAVAPCAMRTIVQCAKLGDRKILTMIEGVTDETVSAILICLMFVFAAVGGVIGTMQINQEATFLVAVTGKMLDDAVQNNPEMYDWLPSTDDFKEHFHTAYIYGRDFAMKTIRSTMADTNETRMAEIEGALISAADQFYNQCIEKNVSIYIPETDPTQSRGLLLNVSFSDPMAWLSSGGNSSSSLSDWSNLLSTAGLADTLTMASQYLDISRVQGFIKEHIETLMSVLDSAWAMLRGNLSLISSLFETIGSVALNYFSAFLNFLLCAVVYLTGLFYLLSSSGRRYRPIEMISSASKYISGAEALAQIVEDTISGIFAVSIKIGSFYGLYTWVLLSFCGVYVRFIPSLFATIFAVCPLVPTYAVILPAALSMWLRGDYITFVILLIGAYLPKLFVDAAIYGDLKTTNPYMFGLSIAGGLVSLGVEGAVFGPLMLCLLTIFIETFKLAIQSRFSATAVPEVVADRESDSSEMQGPCPRNISASSFKIER